MATTPPMMVASPVTPPTPLHGAAYDSPRYRTRAASRRVSQNTGGQSPQITPKYRTTRRIQIISPSSSDIETSIPKSTTTSSSATKIAQPLFSSNTTFTEGMLPTPVKTPKKKAMPDIQVAVRALFQDLNHEGTEQVMSQTKRGRKNKRHNGFSLESFAAHDGDDGGTVQIFTDSRDALPEVDQSESNPFLDPPDKAATANKRQAGGSKRRKISGPTKKDSQVQEAIDRDEGMVYVFRGKKVYRRFDDNDDEEEEIDAEGLAMLEDSPTKPMKTLTRKSIRPRRLFQEHKDQTEIDEEAATDIEDDRNKEAAGTITIDVPEVIPDVSNSKNHKSTGSPFDNWPRLKAATRASPRGKKRSATEVA